MEDTQAQQQTEPASDLSRWLSAGQAAYYVVTGAWPIVHLRSFEAITGRDYVVIQAFTLVVAITYVAVNLFVDLAYAWLDPRIRLS